ncbi:MAG: methylmalonyl Co-A mutase-associated GTPase MeaB [Calditrichaeota bacterium]|nr:methylmalonyl Co-A mutase-associated GTPase MeaB [Calditrichota bacterium]
MTIPELTAQLLAGSRSALARTLSRVENSPEAADEALRTLGNQIGHAVRIGFTGPPGAGKSSLVTAYTKFLRKQGKQVAILAVDPTSPFSGGALLGDRVRMNAIGLDEGVFVRSLATRGDLGGLSQAAGDMADVLDAAGFDYILFETVGVGQSELEVVQYADSVVVVLVPESGDAIQGMKAGLMEAADVFCVNKADREGADRFTGDLQGAMMLKHWDEWKPPVVNTVATREQGVPELSEQIEAHLAHLRKTGEFESRRHAHARRRIQRMLEKKLLAKFWTEEKARVMDEALARGESPYSVLGKLQIS